MFRCKYICRTKGEPTRTMDACIDSMIHSMGHGAIPIVIIIDIYMGFPDVCLPVGRLPYNTRREHLLLEAISAAIVKISDAQPCWCVRSHLEDPIVLLRSQWHFCVYVCGQSPLFFVFALFIIRIRLCLASLLSDQFCSRMRTDDEQYTTIDRYTGPPLDIYKTRSNGHIAPET